MIRRKLVTLALVVAIAVALLVVYALSWWAVATMGPPDWARSVACQQQPVACISSEQGGIP